MLNTYIYVIIETKITGTWYIGSSHLYQDMIVMQNPSKKRMQLLNKDFSFLRYYLFMLISTNNGLHTLRCFR